MKIKNFSLKDLAFYLSDYLRKKGVDTVLSGGACVSIYTDNKFLSFDLDFVLSAFDDQKKIKSILGEIGFYEKNRLFMHDDTMYTVDFLPPPLSVGEEPVKEIAQLKKGNKILKLLSTTDCVKDRLAAYYYWEDEQSEGQAILVCLDNQVDLEKVKRWSKNEGMMDKFNIFKKHLKERMPKS